MSFRGKLLIASILSAALIAGIAFVLVTNRERERSGADVAEEEAPAAATKTSVQDAKPLKGPRAAEKAVPAEKKAKASVRYGPPLAPGEGWTIAGRIVKAS